MKNGKGRSSFEPIGTLDKGFWNEGYEVWGADEVGRGCLAGPVVAAIAKVPQKIQAQDPITLVRDSKTLSAKQRLEALSYLEYVGTVFALGVVSAQEISVKGIGPSTEEAFFKAFQGIQDSFGAGILLVDGNRPLIRLLPHVEQRVFVKGDGRSWNIAAASIIAKVHRDQMMRSYAELYPQYGFHQHVGYGTQYHLDAIVKNGPCPIHRMNFAPLTDYTHVK